MLTQILEFFISPVWTNSTNKEIGISLEKKVLPCSCVSVVPSQQISVKYCSPPPYQSADQELDTPREKNGKMTIVNVLLDSDDLTQLTRE